MKNTALLRIARASATTMAIMIGLSLGAYLSIGSSGYVPKALHSLLASPDFRTAFGDQVVQSFTKDATGKKEKKLLANKSDEISTAVAQALTDPVMESELSTLGVTAYDHFVKGSSSATTIDIRPAVSILVNSIKTVDPEFGKLSKEVNKLEPIDLPASPENSPIPKISSAVAGGAITTVILFLIALAGVVYLSQPKVRALLTATKLFITSGALSIALSIAISILSTKAAQSAGDNLAQAALPPLIAPMVGTYRTIGVTALVLGLAGLAGYFATRKKVVTAS